jgi:hypothetical protein
MSCQHSPLSKSSGFVCLSAYFMCASVLCDYEWINGILPHWLICVFRVFMCAWLCADASPSPSLFASVTLFLHSYVSSDIFFTLKSHVDCVKTYASCACVSRHEYVYLCIYYMRMNCMHV